MIGQNSGNICNTCLWLGIIILMSNTNILAVSIHNQEKKAEADLEEGGPLFFYQTEAQRVKKCLEPTIAFQLHF